MKKQNCCIFLNCVSLSITVLELSNNNKFKACMQSPETTNTKETKKCIFLTNCL